ncbi:hypothetical protein [Staphylococcus warneri]|uniref:hypothetical protein n=2 Tax=Staphylococcus warneri TaxID=1292 RepID=UPI001157A1DE|nr:hypothetical protein [Staphylococcus warneri]
MMWKVKEFRDFDDDDNRLATKQLEHHLLKYPNTQVLGYSVNHFENANNRERSYILIKYQEEN